MQSLRIKVSKDQGLHHAEKVPDYAGERIVDEGNQTAAMRTVINQAEGARSRADAEAYPFSTRR